VSATDRQRIRLCRLDIVTANRSTDMVRDDFHHVGDVAAAAEFELDGVEVVGQVERDVGVDVEVADGFDREFHDASVRNRDVLDSLPGDALFVDEDDATVGQHGQITNQLIGQFDGLVRCEQLFKLGLDAFFVDLGREPEHSGKESHHSTFRLGVILTSAGDFADAVSFGS
jgi:hypothetical protein